MRMINSIQRFRVHRLRVFRKFNAEGVAGLKLNGSRCVGTDRRDLCSFCSIVEGRYSVLQPLVRGSVDVKIGGRKGGKSSRRRKGEGRRVRRYLRHGRFQGMENGMKNLGCLRAMSTH